MDDKRIRPGVWIAVVASLTALVAVLAMIGPRRAQPPMTAPIAAAPSEPLASQPPPTPRAGHEDRSATRMKLPAATEEVPYIEGLVYGDLDLREAKALMPDNLYWTHGAPTKDPAVLEEREKERARRNEEYGRVLAGDASEDEVRAYYDYRQKLSSDYLVFSEFMARRYRDSDNKEFVGMLELATKMHAEKLAQLQTELDTALEHAREREKIREDWKRQQEEFGAAATPPSDDDPAQ